MIVVSLVLVCSLLFAGCKKPVNTDPTSPPPVEQAIRTIKLSGIALEAAVDEGIAFEAGLAEGELDPVFRQKLRDRLAKAKTGISKFNKRAEKYTTFDAAAKADVAKLARDIVSFLEEINEAGLLGIKNPEKQARARRILAGAKLLARGYEIYAQAPL